MIYKRLIVGMLSTSILLSGCANMGSLFEQQPKSHESTSNVSAADTMAAKIDPNLDLEQSPEDLEKSLLEQQMRQNVLALINAPNRFIQTKRNSAGGAKLVLVKALEAYEEQQFSQALTFIEQAKGEPSLLNSGAYVLAGDIYLALAKQAGDTNEKQQRSSGDSRNQGTQNKLTEQQYTEMAQQSFDTALSLNQYNYKAANRRAMLHRKQGEFTQALAMYGKAIDAYPGHALTYRNRGVLQDLYMNNKAAALDDYNTYAEVLAFQQAYLLAPKSELNYHAQVKSDTANTGDVETQNTLITDNNLKPSVVAEFLTPKVLKAELRRVKGWQVDIERQIKAADRAVISMRSGSVAEEVHVQGQDRTRRSDRMYAHILKGSYAKPITARSIDYQGARYAY